VSETLSYGLLAFSSLFSVINAIGAAPLFVGMTERQDLRVRRRTAYRACLTATAVLAAFAIAGGAIFAFFGITVPAFQIAGGILFTTIGLKTLDEGKQDLPDETPSSPADPGVVPLGIPLISGPGAISTVMVLIGQADDAVKRLALGGAIVLNMILTLGILLLAPRIVARLGETGQKVVAKIMGLLTAVVGVQFVINGATTVATGILRHRG